MQVYHFTRPDHALENIRRRRLKISRLNALNDPFEFFGPIFPTKDERGAMKKTKDQLGENRGLICFSRAWRHPLMWGHYADSCKGVCYGFVTVGRVPLVKVDYLAKRPSLARFGIAHASQLTENHMEQILRMKFDAWSYEDEHRLFCGLQHAENGHYFLDFEPCLRLNRVIVGPESTISRDDVMDALGNLQGVQIFQARPAFLSFKMTRQHDARW